jgi:hypothetical protein
MKKAIAITAMSLSLISSQARADGHRAGDAALGALSGAVVFGPIGAVAGAVVGYSAGPSIAHSWGFRHSAHRARAARHAMPPSEAQAQAPAPSEAHAATSAPQALPVPQAAASTAPPPVQTLE